MTLYAISFKGSDKKIQYWMFNEILRENGNPLVDKLSIGCLTESKLQIDNFLRNADSRYKVIRFSVKRVKLNG